MTRPIQIALALPVTIPGAANCPEDHPANSWKVIIPSRPNLGSITFYEPTSALSRKAAVACAQEYDRMVVFEGLTPTQAWDRLLEANPQ